MPGCRLSGSLVTLTLSGNDIGDSAGPALQRLLRTNLGLQLLDLGHNNMSATLIAKLDEHTDRVASGADARRKLVPLTCITTGNEGPAYSTALPGRARGKSTFAFGLGLPNTVGEVRSPNLCPSPRAAYPADAPTLYRLTEEDIEDENTGWARWGVATDKQQLMGSEVPFVRQRRQMYQRYLEVCPSVQVNNIS